LVAGLTGLGVVAEFDLRDVGSGEKIASREALMLEGLFQPMHLFILVVLMGGVFLVFRVLWRLGSKLK